MPGQGLVRRRMQLTDTKFYRSLNEDITVDIQNRVTFYVNRIQKDKLINDKTKQRLRQSDVNSTRTILNPTQIT